MNRTAFTACLLLVLLKACDGAAPEPRPEILGLRLGMGKEEAHQRLRDLGRLEKEERKQQEVWALSADPAYSHLIVAFGKEDAAIRFVTAVAKDGGRRVRFADVIDTGKAQHTRAGNSTTYKMEVSGRDGQPAYTIKAIGNDTEYLKYYSVEVKE
jgi:hypothetical protein